MFSIISQRDSPRQKVVRGESYNERGAGEKGQSSRGYTVLASYDHRRDLKHALDET